ncbi:hypothetical protein Raf01_42340 [Rugosimonospora africana]|uniref:Uncharacterized protein n=1 Tax=Rugosimonospora africana TaxID=556532 RepID=A0A8J3VRF4_9ACTN|nr:hypothetical protein Raf01_42340 [Rugosimonospora africana]
MTLVIKQLRHETGMIVVTVGHYDRVETPFKGLRYQGWCGTARAVRIGADTGVHQYSTTPTLNEDG